MGGLGSGRPRSGRRKVEDCWSLDVNQLRLGGYLRPGCTAERHRTRGGQEIASIGSFAAGSMPSARWRSPR
jgi:hypothetical protein